MSRVDSSFFISLKNSNIQATLNTLIGLITNNWMITQEEISPKGMIRMTQKTALLFGATGLVGGRLLYLLLEDESYQRVVVAVRRPINIKYPKLEQKIIDFARLSEDPSLFHVDDVFCCLGTTIKKVKSQEAFIQVDQIYPLQIAKLAQQAGASQFHIITALGANPNSSIFYNRVKGEVEEGLRTLGLPSVTIYRPSLLLGNRMEFRMGEVIGSIVSRGLGFAMVGPLARYRAIDAEQVAQAMQLTAEKPHTGVRVIESEEIRRIATSPNERGE